MLIETHDQKNPPPPPPPAKQLYRGPVQTQVLVCLNTGATHMPYQYYKVYNAYSTHVSTIDAMIMS